jgi:hypothetical protein
MPFRCSFFFSQQNAQNAGWSESFWSRLSTLDEVSNAAIAMQPMILAPKGDPVQCPYVRISTVGVARQVYILNFSPRTITNPATSANAADFQNTGLLLKMTGLPNYINRQWDRGNPDYVVSAAGQYTPTGAFLALLNAFFAQLTSSGQGWSLRKLDAAQLKISINNISGTGLVTSPGHGLAGNDMVRISGVKLVTGWNTIWRVATAIDANNYQLVAQGAFPSGTPNFTKAKSQKQAETYVQISNCSVQRVTSHRTGRPFGLATGRRRRQTA